MLPLEITEELKFVYGSHHIRAEFSIYTLALGIQIDTKLGAIGRAKACSIGVRSRTTVPDHYK